MTHTKTVSAAALHVRKVQSLYRRALKVAYDWDVKRDLWRQSALNIRAEFEKNRHVEDPRLKAKLIEQTEEYLFHYAHPQPFIYPTSDGGTKYERNELI
ncbi:hypothetical protein GQ42DRAFT_161315 [Ramicandelaber brevisporus]|nr:hypothetical protein GQ42DRAFT_161315 [Ramicandelaber brevisporus]